VVGTLHRQTVHLREDHVTRVRVATLGTVDVPAHWPDEEGAL
jgi:hypothetical protein